MLHLAAGFNPNHITMENPLQLPEDVSLVEVGLAEAQLFPPLFPLSLHIARSPITEGIDTQAKFIESLSKHVQILTQERGHQVVSVGFHLSGSRFEDMGRYGMTSHFSTTRSATENAVRFVQSVQDALHLPVWIENANFYSASSTELLRSLEATQSIIHKTSGGLILDLSHLLIDCTNCGLDPMFALGQVDLGLVQEIHLSGIRIGHDQTLHDGHALPVHPRVWFMLEEILKLGALGAQTYFNLEHTDPEWNSKRELYGLEFQTLRGYLNTKQSPLGRACEREVYAKSYLLKILKRNIPQLEAFCDQNKISLQNEYSNWISEVLSEPMNRLALTPEEIENDPGGRHILAAESFLAHLKTRLSI